MAVRQPRGGTAAYLNGPQPSDTSPIQRYRTAAAVSGGGLLSLLHHRAVVSRRRPEPVRHDLQPQLDLVIAYVPPSDIPELSFYRSRYTSRFVSFASVDTASSTADPHARPPYAPLQTLTAGQRAMMREYDPAMAVPFLRIGNYVQVGTLIPTLGARQSQDGIPSLSHKTWAQVAVALRDPASPIGRYLDGSADFLTAAICKFTGNQPADACTTQIRALEKDLLPAP